MLIKHSSEDFIVEEIPIKEWDISGAYAIFELTKTNLNTEQAIDIIINRFHLTPGIVKYAGSKDKHAKTTQYISIPNRIGINKIQLNDTNIKLMHVGYNDEPLSLGSLKGNKFSITIRELNSDELSFLNSEKLISETTNTSTIKRTFCIPNYFDEQRFSSNNYNIGLCILKKDYKSVVKYLSENNDLYSEKAKSYLDKNPNDYVGTLKYIPKKTLLMFIHAVQSYLFNSALSEILLQSAKENNVDYNVLSYSVGNLVFLKNSLDYQTIEKNFTELELIGFNTLNINYNIKKLLDELNLTTRDFIIRAIPNLSVEGTTRKCIIDVEDLSIIIGESDNIAVIKFELPKGSYATMVIKALLNSRY